MIRLLDRMDRHKRLELLAAQRPGVEAATGVTAEQAATAVWTIAGDERARGAEAIALAIGVALGTPIVVAPFRLRPVAAVLGRAYGWVATNRRRFRGDVPWCAQHAGSCADDRAPSCSLHPRGGRGRRPRRWRRPFSARQAFSGGSLPGGPSTSPCRGRRAAYSMMSVWEGVNAVR